MNGLEGIEHALNTNWRNHTDKKLATRALLLYNACLILQLNTKRVQASGDIVKDARYFKTSEPLNGIRPYWQSHVHK